MPHYLVGYYLGNYMNLVFKVSLIDGLKAAYGLWRDPVPEGVFVVKPTLKLLLRYILPGDEVKKAEKLWQKREEEFLRKSKEVGLEYPDEVTCYLQFWGVEGEFGTDSIRVRRVPGYEHRLADTIIHELVHVATYDPDTYSYEKGEELVDEYCRKMGFDAAAED